MKNKGMHQYRFNENPKEKIVAEIWEGDYSGILEYLLSPRCDNRPVDVSDRDREVAATMIQWLGSPVGQNFLQNVTREWEKQI